MDEAAAEKHRHYDDMATKAGATFVAFVVESNGGFGDEALQHLKKMIQAAQRQSYVWAPAQAINTVYRAIAARLARLAIDNHLIVAENLQWNEGQSTFTFQRETSLHACHAAVPTPSP